MISKFKLGSDNYLIECADMVISKLVKEKDYLYKAYNYYQGFRDKYQFEHLEKNYGVGNPTSVKFTPLIRKHIDAIVGEYLATRIVPKISCKDKRTLTNILRDKQLELQKQVYDYITRFLDNSIYAAMNKQPQQDQKVQDRIIQRELTELQDQVDREFISNYEIAAQDIVQYIMQSRNMDFKNKLSDLILDMLISGQSYYKVKPTKSKKNFLIEVEDPMNTFVFKNPESRYIKDATMSVVRKWLTREEIAIKYGDHLTASDLKDLKYYNGFTSDDERLTWIAAVNSRGDARTSGILAGIEVSNFYAQDYQSDLELIPVYEVEWIDYDASKHKGVLFNVTRIGHEIYILDGENNDLPRSMDDPDSVRITLNGMYYTTRTGIPYSLMLATADLQD